jgi:hypothetical protein
MKKLLFGLSLLGLLGAACSNDFEVAAPWKELPVVYGIISPQDTAVYIRVEKAFLDPEKSALEVAQIADSLYYPESAISVYLQEGTSGPRFQLQRVDATLDGYVRDGGIFASQPNYLYKIRAADLGGGGIQPGKTYLLLVERADGKPTVTAQTTVPKDFRFVRPSSTAVNPMVTFTPNKIENIEWRSDEQAAYFNLTFALHIQERLGTDPAVSKTLYWTPLRNYGIGERLSGGTEYRTIAPLPGVAFYQFLHDNLDSTFAGTRSFTNTDIILKGGGKELQEFQETASANSGLTGAEVIPVFSNVEEGRGLFLSTNTTVFPAVKISTFTVDSLRIHYLTRRLNF